MECSAPASTRRAILFYTCYDGKEVVPARFSLQNFGTCVQKDGWDFLKENPVAK